MLYFSSFCCLILDLRYPGAILEIADVCALSAYFLIACAGDEAISLTELVLQMARIATSNGMVHIEYDPSHDEEKWDRNLFPFANVNMVFDNSKLKALGVCFAPIIERLERDWDNCYSKQLKNDI